MADVLIEGAVNNVSHKCALRSQVFVSASVGYQFFIDAVVDLKYKKTTDGGATWGTAVNVRTGTVTSFDVWYDKWTPGLSTEKIHIAWNDSGTDDVWYASIDTASSDTLDGPRVVKAGATFALISGTMDERSCSITRARGGNLYLYWNGDGTAESGFERSTDGGANWTSRTNHASGVTYLGMLCPANTSDTQDVVIVGAVSGGSLLIILYDDSANTWGLTTVADNVFPDTTYASIAASVRHSDGHVIFCSWNIVNSSAADIRVRDITVDTVGAGNAAATAKTDVITNEDNSGQCCLFIDQNTGDLYVGYLTNGTWLTSARVVYKKSTDGAASWGTETQLDENALADQRALWCDLGGTATRFSPAWHNIDLDDMYINLNTAVVIAAAAGWGPLLSLGRNRLVVAQR